MSVSIKAQTHRQVISVNVPRVPNFLLVGESLAGREQERVNIGLIDDDSLREIGAAWAEALVKRAHEIRKEKP